MKAWKSPLIEEKNAKTQGRKDAKVVDLPQRSGCSVLARRAGTSIWGMTVCGLSNPVYRPSGPLGLYYAPSNRGLRPRQRIYQPSGLRTGRGGSPAETWLSQRQIDIGLEGFLGGIDGRVGVDFEAGRAIEFQFLVACDSVRDAPSVT